MGGGQIPSKKALNLVGAGLRRMSDFLENSVTNVTLLRVTPVWVGVKFPETTDNTLMPPPPSAKWLSLTRNLIPNQIILVTIAGRVTSSF